MKVILLEDVSSLGNAGTIVEVADGYGRNYLIPRGLALVSTPSNLKTYQERQKQRQFQESRTKRDAQSLAEALERISLTATVSVGDEDRMFGSVTSQTLAALLQEKGYDIDRRKIMLDPPIRALGVYTVPIRLLPEVEAKVKVWVVKE